MQTVILGAGQGSRMGDYTSQLPKPFVTVNERAILEWQLQGLKPLSDSVLLVLGYGFDNVKSPDTFVHNRVSVPESIELETLVLDDWNEFENAGSCYHALQSEFVDPAEDIFILCGDVIFDSQITSRFNKQLEEKTECSYVFTIEGIQKEMTAVRWNNNEYITDYGAIEGHQEAGMFFLNSEHLSNSVDILKSNLDSWFPIIFPRIKSKPFFIKSQRHAEINTPNHLYNAESKINNWIKPIND